MRRRAIAAAAVAVSAAMVLTACGGGGDEKISGDAVGQSGPEGDAAWQDVIAQAQAEGEVSIYASNSNESLNELATRFKADYGITVNVVREVDANIQQKVEAEDSTGRQVADVVTQATVSWTQSQGEAGKFVAPTGPAFESGDYDSAGLMLPGGAFVSSAAVMTFGWNTDLHPKPMTSYADVLDPSLANGKVGIMMPVSGAVLDFYNYLKRNYGDDFLDRLAAQQPRLYPSALPMAQALASGEIVASVYVQVQTQEKDSGAPVDSALAETVWGAPFHTGILAKAPHPYAAQLLANYMITPAGQEPLAFKSAAVLPDIHSAVTAIDKVAPQDLSVITPESLEQFRVTFNQLFT